jgi:hypothetical protein
VAGTLAVPALQPSLEAARIEAAARRVAAFLDDTRRRSVLERAVLVVRCRPDEKRLVVDGGEGGERAFEVPSTVSRVSCSPEQMRYHPQGSASGMTLELRDTRGRGRRLTVGAFTGLTRVEVAL